MGWRKNLFKSARARPWQDMTTVPRDGARIELRCSYGYEPWTGEAKYVADDGFHGPIWCFGEPSGSYTFIEAISAQNRQNGASEMHLKWRAL